MIVVSFSIGRIRNENFTFNQAMFQSNLYRFNDE